MILFGAYLNKYNLSLEFVLYDSEKHIQSLKNDSKTIASIDYSLISSNIPIPLKTGNYSLTNGFIYYHNLQIPGEFPAINAFKEQCLQDFQQFKSSELINETYLGKVISASGRFSESISKLVTDTYYFDRRS